MHVSPDLERIFYRLKEMGLEQKAFAQALGTTDKTVSAWKTGRSKSYTKYLPQIAKVIDMPVEYILTGEKKEPAPTPKNGDELDRDAIMAAFIGGDMDRETPFGMMCTNTPGSRPNSGGKRKIRNESL